MFSPHKLTKWTTNQSDKQNVRGDTNWNDISSISSVVPAGDINLCDCNSPDRMVGASCFSPIKIKHKSCVDNRKRTTLSVSGQGNHFTGCEPKTKDAETLCNVSFDLFFYSKIGPFTCKSNAFAEEYEKRDTTMALKEIYILQKGIEKHSNENLSFSAHFLSFVTTYTIN